MFQAHSPTRVNIEEANKHLQMLYNRVADLEQQVAENTSLFERREKETKEEYEAIISLKDAEVNRMNARIGEMQKTTSDLNDQIKLKDTAITELQSQTKVLGEVLQHKPMLEKMLTSLEKVPCHVYSSKTSASEVKAPQQPVRRIVELDVGSTSRKAAKLKEWPKPNLDLSPTITQMATTFKQKTKTRQFSISEDESVDDGIADDVFARSRPEKELYL